MQLQRGGEGKDKREDSGAAVGKPNSDGIRRGTRWPDSGGHACVGSRLSTECTVRTVRTVRAVRRVGEHASVSD